MSARSENRKRREKIYELARQFAIDQMEMDARFELLVDAWMSGYYAGLGEKEDEMP